MKKIIFFISVLFATNFSFAMSVCTHHDFVRKYPTMNLGNCPGDTPGGSFAYCLGSDGCVISFYCSSSGVWFKGFDAPTNETADKLLSAEVDIVEEDRLSEADEEIILLEKE